MPNNFFTDSRQRGVAVLLAVLLVSVVLVISLVLLNITYRQLIISNTARESEIAWYAAESIFNCARYLDTKKKFGFYSYDSVTLDTNGYTPPDPTDIQCGEELLHQTTVVGNNESKFSAEYIIGGVSTCATVTVTKNPDFATPKTTIVARGYNNRPYDSGTKECGTPGPRTVERALQTEYQG